MKKNKITGNRILVTLWKAAITVQCFFYGMTVYATSLEGIKLVTGIKALSADAMKVLLGVEVAVIAALEMKAGLKYQFGEEEEKPKQLKAAKNTLAAGALIVTASGLVTAILSYFQ